MTLLKNQVELENIVENKSIRKGGVILLNEREIELIKTYSKEKGIDYEAAKETYLRFKDTFIELWDAIKESLNDICNACLNESKKQNHNWHIPRKIDIPPMPDVRMPKLHLARSSL